MPTEGRQPPTENAGVKEGDLRQNTRPKKGEPVEIPVPKRSEFDRLLAKAEKPPKK